MEQPETGVEAGPQRVPGCLLRDLVRSVHHRLHELDENVADVVLPKRVHPRGRVGKVVNLHGVHGGLDRGVEPVQRPIGRGREPGCGGRERRLRGFVSVAEVHDGESDGVPEFVAPVAVAHDAEDVEVDVAALRGVSDEGEAHGVGSALGDPVGVILRLALLRLLDLLLLQVAAGEGLVEIAQGDALDDVEGIDDVTEGLGHLTTVRVADHGVEVHLLEGNLAGELHAHHDHARHPEEHDVVAGFQQRRRVKLGEVGGLVRPPKDGEREEPGREPGIEDVLILLQREGFPGELLLSLGARLVFLAADDPSVEFLRRPPGHAAIVLRLALKLDVIRGNAVAPPQLSRDAPVADVLEPPEPGGLHEVGEDLELLGPGGFASLRGHLVARDPPLGLEHGLDDIL